MNCLTSILFQFIFVFLITNESLVHTESTYIEQINLNCSRKCDSHFSDAKCWEKTFKYFSNALMQSYIQYKNAINMALHSKSTEVSSLGVLERRFHDEIKQFEALPENSRIIKDEKLKDFVADFTKILNMTFKKLALKSATHKGISKCPDSCSMNALVIWQSLFGCFIAFTLVTIAFVVSYTIASKIQYQQYDEKFSRNS